MKSKNQTSWNKEQLQNRVLFSHTHHSVFRGKKEFINDDTYLVQVLAITLEVSSFLYTKKSPLKVICYLGLKF